MADNEDMDDDVVQRFSSIDVDEEVKKGNSVKAQLSLWDRLLENRIKLQKLLVTSNKFPQSDNCNNFFKRGSEDLIDLAKEGSKSIKLLLDLLTELQTELLWRNNETRHIVNEQKGKCMEEESDEEIPSDEELPSDEESSNLRSNEKGRQHCRKRKLNIEEYPEFLVKRHKSFTSFRNGTIQKWNDKTRIASGKLNQNSFSAFDQSALKQIEQILSDKPRLIKRTQLKRSKYRILGKIEEHEALEASLTDGNNILSTQKDYDPEIFDDDDFYHQLLRELIERKTTDISDPVALSRHWLEIQKQRTKMKKKIDTKASKGRKVRYDVIPKIMNFKASADYRITTDEAINELCHSLFKEGHQTILYT